MPTIFPPFCISDVFNSTNEITFFCTSIGLAQRKIPLVGCLLKLDISDFAKANFSNSFAAIITN